jgi:hypothetical protein
MKRTLLFILAFLMFGTIAGASSINGDYKGNPIVNVVVNGKVVVSDVPAITLDGTTLIPLRAASEALGATVTWDGTSYTANISQASSAPANASSGRANTVALIKSANTSATKFNARNVKYVINDLGAYVSVDVLGAGDASTDLNNIAAVSAYLQGTEADLIFVNTYAGNLMTGFYSINKETVSKFLTSNLTFADYIKSWEWNPTGTGSAAATPTTTPSSPAVTSSKEFPKLYSSDGKVYLGTLTTNEFDAQSIYNQFGTYGSDFSSTSIWNDVGTYGSSVSSSSAFNDLASSPPIIVQNGKIIGYLTTNSLKANSISPYSLKQWLSDNGY